MKLRLSTRIKFRQFAHSAVLPAVIFFIVALFFVGVTYAATFTAGANGNWNLGTTWGKACASGCTAGTDYPGQNDNAIITNKTVTLTTNASIGSTTISSTGVLNLGSYILSVYSNFSNTGTLNANTGTVNFMGTNQFITGTSTFFNLTKQATSSADTINFGLSTTTISGALTLQGTATSTLTVRGGEFIYASSVGTSSAQGGIVSSPAKLATDSAGNIYVTDLNYHIQKFDSNGNYVSQFGSFGTGNGQIKGTQDPIAIATSSGNIYVGDTFNSRITKFDSSGNYLTSWGTNGNGAGQIKSVGGIAIDSAEQYVYISDDGNHRVDVFNATSGAFVRAFGWGVATGASAPEVCTATCQIGLAGTGVGEFNSPIEGLAVGTSTVYVADYINAKIIMYSTSGTYLSSLTGSAGANFSIPYDVSVDSAGNFFVIEYTGNRIQEFASTTAFIQKWGTYGTSAGQMNHPLGIAVDSSGNVYAADTSNNRINKYASSNGAFISQFGISSNSTGVLSGTQSAVADSSGNVYVAENNNVRIEKFDSDGNYLLGMGSAGSGNGQFNGNYVHIYLALDPLGNNIYATDFGNARINEFSSSGAFVTKWGSQGTLGGQFAGPSGNGIRFIATDPSSNVYVVDSGNNRFQKFDSSGNFIYAVGWGVATGASSTEICTVSANCRAGFGGSGVAEFNGPSGIAVSADGNYVYVVGNSRVQKYDSSGNYISVFGSSGSSNGQFLSPQGITIDSVGNILVSDTNNNRVEKFDSNGNYLSQFGSVGTNTGQFGNNGLSSISVDSSGRNAYTTDSVLNRVQKFHTLWQVLPQGSVSASRLTVKDSYNASSTAITCVNCTDGGGNTNWTFTTVNTVPDAPTAVTAATTTPNQANISFTPGYNGGSTVLYYLASSTPGNFTATSSASPITVSGLTNNTSYTFQVYAVNSVGTSSASAVSNAVTPIAAVTYPYASTTDATSMSTSTAVLNGTVTSIGGSSVTTRGFAYGLTTAYGATTTETGTFSAGNFSTTTIGLTPNTVYHFQAYATNAIGTSYGGDLTFTTSKYTVPDAPSGVTAATTAFGGQASISFTAPASNGSPILYYIASSTTGGIVATSTVSPIIANWLTNGTSYSFKVMAVNALGTSSASSASNSVTPTAASAIGTDPTYLLVTGTPTPDATGIYAPIGIYNGDTLYARQADSAFYIWHNPLQPHSTSEWELSVKPPSDSSWASSEYWSFFVTRISGTNGATYLGASGTTTISVYDPNNPNGTPVLLSISTATTPPQYAAKMLISSNPVTGAISPDATGLYDLQGSTYNGSPVWTREDGAYSIWAMSNGFWRLSTTIGDTSAGSWNWNYKDPTREEDSTGTTGSYTGIVTPKNDDPNFPTVDQYLAGLSHPMFKTGNTLPPLTRYGWGLSYWGNKELAHWGYAVDFGSTDPSFMIGFTNATTTTGKLITLVNSDPTDYKLSVNMGSTFQNGVADSAFVHDSGGSLISPKTLSPAASDSIIAASAASTTNQLQQVQNLAPISFVLNGGERGLAVYGWGGAQWNQDPTVLAAKGSQSWSDYISNAKAQQEMHFTNDAHAVTHNAPYMYYTIGGNPSGCCDWDWDYKYTQAVSDLPSNESYYSGYQGGSWTYNDRADQLTHALMAVGYATSFGKPLSYNWMSAGFNLVATSTDNSDVGLYTGFLKTYYTAGMIGGNAGYYSYPVGGFVAMFDKNAPPNWVQQIEALSNVHAEFSWLEDMERNGDLLPGDLTNKFTQAPTSGLEAYPRQSTQPAYEFWTGFYNDRVLARKLHGQKRWLISAWAADAIPRTVSVTIPTLGTISVLAQPTGTLYDARIVGGVQHLTVIDNGSMTPTVPSGLTLPSSTPDSDSSPYPTVALSTTATNSTAKIGDTITLTATPSNLYASASSTKFLANNALLDFDAYQSSSYSWTPTAPGTYSVVAVVGDTAGNYVSSNPANIEVDSLDTTAPLISINAPAVGSTVSGSSITLSASSSDPTSPQGQITSGLAGVQFMLDGTTNIGSLVTSTSSPNTYTTTWDSTGITSYGSHTIYAVASDAAGNYATSTVTVNVDNVAPTLVSAVHNSDTQITVTLSKLANASTITKSNDGGFTVTKTGSGTTYAVSSIAPGSDNTKVVLTVADMTSAGASGVKVTYLHSGNGTVADTLGNLLATDATGITIPPWNTTAPIISSITSTVSNGAYKLGTPIDIDLTFSKAINTSGTVTVTMNTGGTCSFSGISNSTAASCTYTVGSGENANPLNVSSVSGSIISTDGNDMTSFTPALNLSANKTIVIDTVAPSVSVSVPSDGATVTGSSVTLTAFNSDTGSGIQSVQFKLDNTTIGSSGSTNPYSITWDSTSASNASHTLYAVAKDLAGNYATSSISITVDNTVHTYSIGGTVSGLSGTVVLQNNSGDDLSVSYNGSFTFATSIANGNNYGVTVKTNPSGQTCVVSSGSGTVSGGNVTGVAVTCTTNSVTPTPTPGNGPTYSGGSSGGSTSAAQQAYLRSIYAANGLTCPPTLCPPATSTAVSAPNTPYQQPAFVRTMKIGSTGSDVKALQAFLNSQGFTIASTGAGSPGHETSTFGPATQAALIRFQNAHAADILTPSGLTSGNGVFGPMTMKYVNSLIGGATQATTSATTSTPAAVLNNRTLTFTRTLQVGSVGDDVKQLQISLNTHGYTIAVNGPGSPGYETTTFGSATKAALMKFQKAQGIPSTGFFGPLTLKAVNALTK